MPTLDTLMDRDYVVEARQRKGRHFLTIEELGVIASADTFAKAYAALEKNKTDYFNHHISCGTTDGIALPRDQKEKRELRPFFIKAATVALVSILLLSVSSIAFSYALRDPVRNLGQRAGRATLHQFMGGLKKFAQSEMTPKKEKQIRQAIREVVPKLKPYVEELRPLFDTGEP